MPELPNTHEPGTLEWLEYERDAALEREASRERRYAEPRPEPAPKARATRPPEPTPPKAAPREAWPQLDSAARHGLVGKFLDLVEPHSEADPAALLFQLLTAFGASVGRSPYFQVEGDKHRANLFCVIVGDSAKARKGTSWGQVRRLIALADPTLEKRIVSGLSSGEGLLWAVRDPLSNDDVDAPEDRRLLAIESEFASVLKLAARDGNILSPTLRNAWDAVALQSLTKGSPARAAHAHISAIGHITQVELSRHLNATEIANGLGNRFNFVCSRRSKLLPFGGDLDPAALESLGRDLRDVLSLSRSFERVTFDPDARDLWQAVYPHLSESQPGMFGSLTARSEAQTLRLSLVYALLDSSRQIRADHLLAGLAVWDYAAQSARYLFGSSLGDPLTDRILEALRLSNGAGLTRTAISKKFSGHVGAEKLDLALVELQAAGLATATVKPGAGRPSEVWRYVSKT